jgi:uncharacterized membrane protein YphA (DoxX/SURF4 family)
MDFICIGSTCEPALRIAQLLITAFIAVLFTQSGLDKVKNWKDELGWITEHFSSTPFKGAIPQLLAVLTLFEVGSGLICGLGTAMLLLTGEEDIAMFGLALAGVTLLQLFAGQRIAKDYPGAVAVAPYFLLTVIGLILMSQN